VNVIRCFRCLARSALAALAIGALASCKSENGPAGPNPPAAAGDFQTTLSLDPGEPGPEAQLQATLGYTLPASAEPLGAYLVEVRFDPARLTFVASDPAMASGRAVNELQTGSGSIVVAGARTRVAGIQPADLSFVLREVADTRLREIPK
jgi:hypothetical protein